MRTLAQEMEILLPVGTSLRFGQLSLSRPTAARFEARHIDDVGTKAELHEVDSVPQLREIAKFDAAGEYRPLKTAPTLVPGWRTTCESPVDFLKSIDAVYPAVFATWVAHRSGGCHPTPLRRTLDRQTGMYRFAGTITDAMAERIVGELCRPGCLRQIAWPIRDDEAAPPIPGEAQAIPMICSEACTFAISAARTLAKEAFEKSQETSVPTSD